jgi:hypothetical protein
VRFKLHAKEISRGISCLKYNLAKILWHEVDICPSSTLEIVHLANQSVLDIGKKKDEKEALKVKLAARGVTR